MVLAVCRRLLPDAAEAEDAMQQTFVSAYRSLLAGSEPRQAAVWLAAIARNECLDRIRARMREPLAEHGRNGGADAPDTLAAVIAGEEFRALNRSIEELPTQQRDALLLHEFCGLSYEDVAAAIGVSESAIGSLLFRARRTLRSAVRRGYAVLPLSEIWNATAQLVARGPAIKVAALPVVAKVGCGAVAVGLTAGAVVAVEHEVETKAGPRSAPTHVSAAPAILPGARAAAVSRPVLAGRAVRLSTPETAVPVVSKRPRTPSLPETHRVRSVPTAAGSPTAPAHEPVPAAASPTRGTNYPTRGQSGSVHVSNRRGADGPLHRGSPSAKTSTKHPDKQKAVRATPASGKARHLPTRTGAPAGAAIAPGLARGHDEHGPPGSGATVDPSAPSADATPSASSTDHPEHPEHPDHPVKS
jgi:RNA polymerase sigma factor (sigma-70 family)